MSTITPPISFKSKRKRALRLFIFRRDRFTCQNCGWTPNRVPLDYDGAPWAGWLTGIERLHVDHIIPRCAGGPSRIPNLQTLCGSCNSRKASADARYADARAA